MTIPSMPFKQLRSGRDQVSASEYNRLTGLVTKIARSLMINGLMDSTGFHTSRQPRGGYIYIDRGEAATADFTKGSLTIDNSWHDLDLSSIVPSNAELVVFKCGVSINDQWSGQNLQKVIFANANTETPGWNTIASVPVPAIIDPTTFSFDPANADFRSYFIYTDNQFTLPLTADKKIKYNVTTPSSDWTFIDIVIMGWWV
ncbi:hypothetical protein LCGC14_0931000 [marine sediment metagenome]|uniref:Uncharacterized protein n=1 Tax=marine sediment metagenome TaxID=412755 RepID=A0A0F9R6H6_9ZZZZ